MRAIVLILIISSISTGCSSSQYSLEKPSPTFITLNSHGGFTGESVTQYFFENGQCYEESSFSGVKELTPISADTFTAMHLQLEALNFENREIHDPGNMNYSIRLKTPNFDQKVLFNTSTKNVDELLNFYKKYFRTEN